uniref:Uncharacterized protein n=1 Tax=Arundo donax TaxID=35708 RepID=A0A0A9FTL7_ARUDO
MLQFQLIYFTVGIFIKLLKDRSAVSQALVNFRKLHNNTVE